MTKKMPESLYERTMRRLLRRVRKAAVAVQAAVMVLLQMSGNHLLESDIQKMI